MALQYPSTDAASSTDAGARPEREDDSRPTFPSPFEFNARDPITLVELRMHGLSGMIRQKPRWWEKVQDDTLVAKWRAEMVEYDRMARWKEWGADEEDDEDDEDEDSEDDGGGDEEGDEEGDEDDDEDEVVDKYGPKQWPRDALTEAQLDYVFDELKYLASQMDEKTGIHVTSIPGVYQSASLISSNLRQALVRGVSLLEDVPEDEKDWHPGSKRQVLDLVHPSLYCLRLGKSLIRRTQESRYIDPGKDPLELFTLDGYLEARNDFSDVEYNLGRTISTEFQWLPTVFDVSDMSEVKREGYINNLHPIKHASLYPTITSLVQRFVPMFERVLSDAVSPVSKRVIDVDVFEWYSHAPEKNYDEDGYQEWKENRWPLIPDPPAFTPPTEEGRVHVNLKGRSIRIIVKLANIILTPEKPSYSGGSWHVEGMENEKIVATGLYYYASENITESRLAFRMQIGTDPECMEMGYQHDDHQGWRAAFGLSTDDPLNQELGYVIAEEGKCVAFPNIYQHRVEPFELADHTRPGHRKILALFLTDPYQHVPSTTMVPPQQREWYLNEMERIPALRNLPRELFDMVSEYALEGTITREEAKADRKKLMKERRNFVMQHNEDVFEVKFSLCEH